MQDVPRPRPQFLHKETTRHGTVFWYVRRGHGARIRLRAAYDTPEFWSDYRAALEGRAAAPKAKPRPHTLRWALDRYRSSSEWAAFSSATRKQRENIFRQVIDAAGDDPLDAIDTDTILAGREKRASRPHSANNFLKSMRGFYSWACGDGKLCTVNPMVSVKLLKGKNDAVGFHTWTDDEVARFEARWAVGTRQRLALDLLLYTGLRRGDVVRLGRQHVRDGVAVIRMEKGGKTKEVFLPILAPLLASINATKTGDLTFLVTERGTPFVKESFGNWFREAARAAGVPGSAHGLRKAGATRAAENGASERQLMALFGWSTAKMAVHYTQAADQRRLSKEAAPLLLPGRDKNEAFPNPLPGSGAKAKRATKSGR